VSLSSPTDRDFQPDPARWRALAVCLIAGAMTLLDVSIVNVALPTLQAGLRADESDLQWIIAGYALAFGVVLVPAGRLGDARSRRTVFIAGVALFTLASAAAGAAPAPWFISLARVLQGVGGGLITPQVSGFIQNLFRGPERARAFSLFGASIGISTAIGPLLGGVLVNLGGPDFGWRLVFYVNVPVGVLLIVLARKFLPAAPPSGRRQSLDPLGVVLFAVAVMLVLWPLVEGGQGEPLSRRPWWLLAPAVALLVGFYVWERVWQRRGRETLVDLSLLKVRSYMFGLSLGTFYFAGFTSIFLIVTLYLQVGLKYTAFEAGLTTTPFAVGSAVSAYASGKLVERYGRWLAVGGLVGVSIALVLIDLLVPHLSGSIGLKLAPVFLLAGLGGGLVVSPNVTLTLAEVDPARAGSGGGMLQTAQRVGSAIGVAVILAQFFAQLGQTRGDYAEALSVALRTTVGFVAVALLFALLDLIRRRTGHPATEEPQRAAEPEPRPAG
jgi:EmrB/QacA subfamily drug resistance transporter